MDWKIRSGNVIGKKKPSYVLNGPHSMNFCSTKLVQDQFFYYTQIYPDLASLYLVLVTILEFANLIEPSCDLSSTFLQFTMFTEKQINCCVQSERWHHLNNALTDFFPHLSGQNDHKLDRYALILMLVAYFNSNRTKLERKNYGDQLITLLDF